MDFYTLFENMDLAEGYGQIPNNYNIRACIPSKDDFKKISNRFNDYRSKGKNAEFINTPWGLAYCTKDFNKKIKYLIIAMFIKYDELAEALKDILAEEYNKDDIKNILTKDLAPYYSLLAGIASNINVKKTESLQEASNLTPLEKMQQFDNGTRRENIKACSDQKLFDYYNITVNERLHNAKEQILEEIRRRNLILKLINDRISLKKINFFDAKYVRNRAQSNDAYGDFLRDLRFFGDPPTQLFVYLMFALSLNEKNVANILADLFTVKYWIHKDKLKTYIQQFMQQRPRCLQAIVDSINTLNGGTKTESLITLKERLLMVKDSIKEDIEKHEELNPKLWTENNELKPEVKDKILEIVKDFTDDLKEDEIKIEVSDIVLVGSNASYNYTKNSDLDIHIIADTKDLDCPEYIYNALYSAYRSLFNKKLNIEFYDIPVEIYIETEQVPLVSNGCYSVMQDKWLKEPVYTEIPDYDHDDFDNKLSELEQSYNDLIAKADLTTDEIKEFIEKLYELRKEGLSNENGSEWSIQNLLFKEFRNRGYLDKLKDLKNEIKSKELSLESLRNRMKKANLVENLTDKEIADYRIKIQQLTHHSPIVSRNKNFEIYNIDESEVQSIMNKLKQTNFIKYVQKAQTGYNFNRFDFSQMARPHNYYKIYGQIK